MPWVKLSDDINDHPKMIHAGPLAQLLYFRGLVYASRYLTDGYLSHPVVLDLIRWDRVRLLELDVDDDEEDSDLERAVNPGIPAYDPDRDARGYLVPDNLALATILVRVGLWEEAPGGYHIHDFGEYNPSSKQTRSKRFGLSKQRAFAGRAGGIVSAQSRRSKTLEVADGATSYTRSKREANGKQKSSPVPVPVPHLREDGLRRGDPDTSGTPGQIAPPAPLAPAAPPVQKPVLSREDIQAQKNAAKVIPAIEKLEAGKPDPFDPGAWWGWAGKQNIPYPSRLDALMALGKRLKAGDRPENVWAYMTKTGNEKRANHYADKAESESEERRLPERKDRHA